MATTYPESIDTVITLPTALDNATPIRAVVVNALRDAIIETEAELGVQPAGVYGTVRNRLDILEFAITGNTNLGGTFFSGDLTGNFSGQEVVGFYGRPLIDGAPLVGQVYSWDGYQWALTQPGGGGSPYGTFGSQGYPGLDATVSSGKITIYQDGDNQTYLSKGTSYSGSGTGLIAVSEGTNPTPSALTTGSSSFQGRPYSRSDRIVTQIVAANTGRPTKSLIYTGPPPNSDGGAGATLLTVMVVGASGFEQPSCGSWNFMFDTTHNSGGAITTTTLYTYNPNSLTTPAFSVDSSGNVSITFATDYYNWTIVVISATMVIAGSL